MLPAETIRRIRHLQFRAARQVDAVMAGRYRSVFRGEGIEFEEVREYCPGDDVRSIDWKVSARMGRPFVKLYREERERTLMLLVDLSRSVAFGSIAGRKRDTAAETAAILAFSALRSNDRVGAILFTDRVEQYLPPTKGAAHIWRVIRAIYDCRPSGRGTAVAGALDFLARVQRRRVVGFVISDFIGEDCGFCLRRVARQHELIAVMLSDPGEFLLPEGGLVTVEDLESGRRLLIDAGNRRARGRYTQSRLAAYNERLKRLRATGLDLIELSTVDGVVESLVAYFLWRARRRHR